MLNETEALQDPLSISAKYRAFDDLPFTSICLGMQPGKEKTGYLRLSLSYHSLSDYFYDNRNSFQKTEQPLSAWSALIDMPEKTNQCASRQGFNMHQYYGHFRIGIATNENDCTVQFSSTMIAVGIGAPLWCDKDNEEFTAGYQFCSPVNEPHHLKPALTYIYLK